MFYRPLQAGLSQAMPLHELPDDELKEKLSAGELSDKKAAIAEAVLRHRRIERIQAWLKRHAWLAALVGALGLSAWLLPTVRNKE
jgi:hypothetical protein